MNTIAIACVIVGILLSGASPDLATFSWYVLGIGVAIIGFKNAHRLISVPGLILVIVVVLFFLSHV